MGMSRSLTPWPLILIVAGAVAGCGGSSSPASTAPGSSSETPAAAVTPTPTPAPTPTPTPAPAFSVASCPLSSSVSQVLGETVSTPNTNTTSSLPLPSGASGIRCLYPGSVHVPVMITLAENVPAADFSAVQMVMAGADTGQTISQFTPVAGVGDQAVTYSLASETATGVIAIKGTDVVDVTTLFVAVPLSQIESLVTQLLT